MGPQRADSGADQRHALAVGGIGSVSDPSGEEEEVKEAEEEGCEGNHRVSIAETLWAGTGQQEMSRESFLDQSVGSPNVWIIGGLVREPYPALT